MLRSYEIVENLGPGVWKLHPNRGSVRGTALGIAVTRTTEQLSAGLAEDKRVHIAKPGIDLAAELKRGIAFAEKAKKQRAG